MHLTYLEFNSLTVKTDFPGRKCLNKNRTPASDRDPFFSLNSDGIAFLLQGGPVGGKEKNGSQRTIFEERSGF